MCMLLLPDLLGVITLLQILHESLEFEFQINLNEIYDFHTVLQKLHVIGET